MQSKSSTPLRSRVGKITKKAVMDLQKEVLAHARIAAGRGEPPQEFYLWDTEISNFGMRVKPSGHATFLLRYRMGPRRKQEAIGTFEDPWTVQMAREKAISLKGDVVDGVDPKQVKQVAKDVVTVAKLAVRFLEEHVEPLRKATTKREYRRQLDKIILRAFGQRPVKEISFEDIAKLHHSLKATPVQANRVIATLSKMFNLAEKWGLRPHHSNPCLGIEKFPEMPRERFLSEAEFKRLGAALNRADEEGIEWPYVTSAIRMLIFTGARLNEILTLRWDQVDLAGKFIRLTDHKTAGTSKAKIIYLNEMAALLLENMPRALGNPYVVPGRRATTHLVNLEDPWQRIRAAAKLPDVHLHDLRHSFAAVLASSGTSLPIIVSAEGTTPFLRRASLATLSGFTWPS